MDGVQRILVLSFTARTRTASRGREAPEEWASLPLFIFLLLVLGGTAHAMDVVTQHPLPQPEVMDKNSPEYQAAKGFEIHFMQEMMRNMRKTIEEDPAVANTPGHKIFQGMLDDQYAETAARTQGIGLAELIVKQLHEQQQVAYRRPAPTRELNKSDVLRK
jgi:Rod binding domain-containing protein